MSESVVFQAYSETGPFGVDLAIVAASVVQVLRRQGVEAFVRNEGLEGLAWAEAHGVPEAEEEQLQTCEVLLRAWPAGSWPARPEGPRTVVDFVQRAADRSGQADFVVAFEADDTPPFPGLVVWDVLFPLPVEVNEVSKDRVDDVVLIHLGQDPTGRLAGLRAAIHGFAGMAALGLQYPGSAGGAGIVVTASPWDHLASGDVALVTPEFPFRLAAAMRVPAVLVGSTAEEALRVLQLTARGHSSFLSLGLMSGLTDNQIRDAVRDLRNDDAAKRVARLGGSEQQANEGVLRLASWVSRELVGRGLEQDPYQVEGFDTVLDPQTKVPLNAEAAAVEAGAVEDEVPTNVQVFTADGTWTRPDNAKFVEVVAISGGGGGGSGRRGAAGGIRGGGAGGENGAYSYGKFSAPSLPASVAVVVGPGGAGGLPATADNTNGNPGTSGSRSSFGAFVVAGPPAPLPNNGGGTAAAGGVSSVPADYVAMSADGLAFAGGNGGAAFPAIAGGVLNGYRGGAPGGGGGGITAGDVETAAGDGGYHPARSSLALAGATPGDDGASGESVLAGEFFGGAGGAGGASNAAAAGGMGGAGGTYGGAGGGGGASVNGFDSGAGAQGADGVVVVVTFF